MSDKRKAKKSVFTMLKSIANTNAPPMNESSPRERKDEIVRASIVLLLSPSATTQTTHALIIPTGTLQTINASRACRNLTIQCKSNSFKVHYVSSSARTSNRKNQHAGQRCWRAGIARNRPLFTASD
jgi:hypothetical protein